MPHCKYGVKVLYSIVVSKVFLNMFQCSLQLCPQCFLIGPHCDTNTSDHEIVSTVDAYRLAVQNVTNLYHRQLKTDGDESEDGDMNVS